MKIIGNILTIIIIVIALNSCNKTEISPPNTNPINSENFYFSDGMIHFIDSLSYINFQNWIFMNQDNPKNIENRLRGFQFTSMMSIYKKGMQIEDEKQFLKYVKKYPNVFYPVNFDNSILYELQAPSILAYFCNKDGLFSIKGKIYRITFDYYYVITDGDKSKIPLLFKPAKKINDKSILTFATKSEKTKGQYYKEVKTFNTKLRIVARLYEDKIGYLWYYRAITTGQHKRLGIWWRKKMDAIIVNWDNGYYYEINNPTKFLIESSINVEYNDSQIERTIVMTNYQIDKSKSSCIVTFRGIINNDSRTIIHDAFF